MAGHHVYPNLDYRLLEALFYISQTLSFEKAAKKLHITQSAISQRIKQLEIQLASKIIVRSTPVSLTPLGESLVAHYRKIMFLEDQWKSDHLNTLTHKGKVNLASNRDSLNTWLPKALSLASQETGTLFEIWAEDQSQTIRLVSSGLVEVCISSEKQAVKGYDTVYLGSMDYYCVGTPEFKNKYFHKKKLIDALKQAPATIFDKHDQVHGIFLEHQLGVPETDLTFPYHEIPSNHCFVELILAGQCFGMVPSHEVSDHLSSGRLIELFPGKRHRVPLYLHSWSYGRAELRQITEIFIEAARKSLIQPDKDHPAH